MSAAHTPGPWSTYINTMDNVVVRKVGVSGYEIAHIAIVRTGIQDARLISAAPELLEVLSRYVQQDQAHGCTDNNLFRSAQDAISKATGEQQ